MHVAGKLISFFLFVFTMLGSLVVTAQVPESEDVLILKPQAEQAQEAQASDLKLHFSEDEKKIAEKRNQLINLGKNALLQKIADDLQKHFADEAKSTEVHIPLGPRIDLNSIDPDLGRMSKVARTKAEIKEYLNTKTIADIAATLEALTVEQLADFIVRKEAWLLTAADSVFNIYEKTKMGSRDNPKTIKQVNTFIGSLNNAFYMAPLNVAYSNTFIVQGALSGYIGVSAGSIVENFASKKLKSYMENDGLEKAKQIVRDTSFGIQKVVEKKLGRPEAKPWITLNGNYGMYLSLSVGPAISFRTVNGRSEINLEMFSQIETYKSATTPVLQVYPEINAGIALEERGSGTERLFKYKKTFIPFVGMTGKGAAHMDIVAGIPLVPNLPGMFETQVSRLYFMRLPLNGEASASKSPSAISIYLTDLQGKIKSSCANFFK